MIDITKLIEEGEFGSESWCVACAAAAVAILKSAELPIGVDCAFTEQYTYPPERLLSKNRVEAAYFVMVKDGEISGGDGKPREVLALHGLHVTARRAAIVWPQDFRATDGWVGGGQWAAQYRSDHAGGFTRIFRFSSDRYASSKF